MKKGLRRCAQCRIINDQRLMLRWRAGGRSWYFCAHRDCLSRAQKNKHLKQALQAGDGVSWLMKQSQKLLP